jgi:hypothetical protein
MAVKARQNSFKYFPNSLTKKGSPHPQMAKPDGKTRWRKGVEKIHRKEVTKLYQSGQSELY